MRSSVRGRRSLLQTDRLVVHYPQVTRPKRRIGGVFQEVEGTGRYDRRHSRVMAIPRDCNRVLVANGLAAPGRESTYIDATAAGVKTSVRRLRRREAEQLNAIDTEVTELEERITALRAQRAELVAKAWTNAHVVRLDDLKAMAVEGYSA